MSSDQVTVADKVPNAPENKGDKAAVSNEDREGFIDKVNRAWKAITDGTTSSGVTNEFGKPSFFGFGDEDIVTVGRVEHKKAADFGAKPADGGAGATPADNGTDGKPDSAAAKPKDFQKQPAEDEDDIVRMHKQSDGTHVMEYKNGDVAVYDPKDKSIVTVKEDKTVVESRADGTVIETSPEGKVTTTKGDVTVTQDIDGTKTTVDSAKGLIITDRNGEVTKTQRRADSWQTTLPNGDKQFDMDDETQYIQRHDGGYEYFSKETGRRVYDKNGELQSVEKQDEWGITTKTFSDGTVVTVTPENTRTHDDGHGNKQTFYANGRVFEQYENGKTIDIAKDGSRVIQYKDGSRAYQDANGHREDLKDNEQVVFKNR